MKSIILEGTRNEKYYIRGDKEWKDLYKRGQGMKSII